MKSREFKKIYHPSLGRYVYEHRGNGLIVDNIMKPLKGAISTAAKGAQRAVARAIGKKASKAPKAVAAKVAEKSGDLIRRRLKSYSSVAPHERQMVAPKTPKILRGRSNASKSTKMSQNEVNALINNLIARS